MIDKVLRISPATRRTLFTLSTTTVTNDIEAVGISST